MKNLYLFLSLSFVMLPLLSLAQGRSPSVLNEKAISIEERRQIPPDQAKEFGYNFNSKSTNAAHVVERGISSQQKQGVHAALVIFGLTILALPLVVWFMLMRQLRQQRQDNQDTISLEEFREKQKELETKRATQSGQSSTMDQARAESDHKKAS